MTRLIVLFSLVALCLGVSALRDDIAPASALSPQAVEAHQRALRTIAALQKLERDEDDEDEAKLDQLMDAVADAASEDEMFATATVPIDSATAKKLEIPVPTQSNNVEVAEKGTLIYESKNAPQTNAHVRKESISAIVANAKEQAKKDVAEKMQKNKKVAAARKFAKKVKKVVAELDGDLVRQMWGPQISSSPKDNTPATNPLGGDAPNPTQIPSDTSTWIYNPSINAVPSKGPFPGKNDVVLDNATMQSPRWHMWPSDEVDNLEEVLEKLPVPGNLTQERTALISTILYKNEQHEEKHAQLLVPSQFATQNVSGWPTPIIVTPYGTLIIPTDALRQEIEKKVPPAAKKPNPRFANFFSYYPLSDLLGSEPSSATPASAVPAAPSTSAVTAPAATTPSAVPNTPAATNTKFSARTVANTPTVPAATQPAPTPTPAAAQPTPAATSGTAAPTSNAVPTQAQQGQVAADNSTNAPPGAPVNATSNGPTGRMPRAVAPPAPPRTATIVPFYDEPSVPHNGPVEIKAQMTSKKFTKVQYVPKNTFKSPPCGDACAAAKARRDGARTTDSAAAILGKTAGKNYVKPGDFYAPVEDLPHGYKPSSEASFSSPHHNPHHRGGAIVTVNGFNNGFVESPAGGDGCTVAIIKTPECDATARAARIIPVVTDYDYKK